MAKTAVERVAEKVGSLGNLGRICGVHPSQPCHWNRPLGTTNGRGGSIPDRHHAAIIAHCRKHRIPLKAGELVNV